MKRISYIIAIIICLVCFSSVKALSVVGDGKWHKIDYNELRDNFGVKGSVISCTTSDNNIEVQINKDGTPSCQVRTKTVTNSNINASFYVKYQSIGSAGSSTVNATITKGESITTDDVLPSAGDAKVTSGKTTESEDYFKICDASTNPQLVAGFRLVGIFLTIVKIIVPIILIVMGSIDMSKAVISKENGAIQKQLVVFLKRAIAGILIFFAPTIVLSIFHLVDGMDNFESTYKTCLDCMLGSDCPNVSFKGN